MSKKHRAEILAPAGGMDSFIAAVRCGCDAVYIGAKSFSARQNADNFSEEEIYKLCEIAHLNGIKVYLTVNTIMFDEQLEDFIQVLRLAGSAGIDALLIQDLGAYYITRKVLPDMPIHTSTQMSIHSKSGVLIAKEMGFERAVVAREMSKEQLQAVCGLGIEIEAFVHGALCVCVSGQCYMSALIGSRSANRGLCAQACRLPISANKGDDNRYDLSLKDLSYVNHIKELEDMGIASLKIEGRMKRPEYVAAAVTACRKSLDGEDPDTEMLRAVFSRNGFTDGYYTDRKNSDMFGIRSREDVQLSNDILPKIHELYRKERGRVGLHMKLTVKIGQNIELIVADEDGNGVKIETEPPQLALNRPTTFETAKKQLSKLGSTIYYLENLVVDVDSIAMVSSAHLNDMRRKACSMLGEIRIKENTKIKNYKKFTLDFSKNYSIKLMMIRAEVRYAYQLRDVKISLLEKVIIPLEEAYKALEMDIPLEKIIITLPRYIDDEDSIINELQTLKQSGFKSVECQNIAHIRIGKMMGFELHGGYGLNVSNSYSLKALQELGLTDCTASFEMKLLQISRLSDNLAFGIIAYGNLPMMLTVNCPIKHSVGCKNCKNVIYDKTGREFEVHCHQKKHVEIFNTDKLFLADKLSDIKGVSFITLKFTKEDAKEVSDVIDMYRKGATAPKDSFTRGLYYRGVNKFEK